MQINKGMILSDSTYATNKNSLKALGPYIPLQKKNQEV